MWRFSSCADLWMRLSSWTLGRPTFSSVLMMSLAIWLRSVRVAQAMCGTEEKTVVYCMLGASPESDTREFPGSTTPR